MITSGYIWLDILIVIAGLLILDSIIQEIFWNSHIGGGKQRQFYLLLSN